ncbi:MAG: c-type cytochrome [Phycisphaerae bacterium]|nr:c-type cytochrome [Phycisphaerae bacterium]
MSTTIASVALVALGVGDVRVAATATSDRAFTVEADGPQAFSLPMPALSREERRAFSVGNSFFRDSWVVAPASAAGRDGLGPLFNATSCSACHPDDGRGRPPRDANDVGAGMVVFVSAAASDGAPHPIYGGQIQDQAIPGVRREARVRLEPIERRGQFPDGTPYALRAWQVHLDDPAYGPLGDVRLSPRVGQQIVGMGLLEALDDAALLALEDPDDANGDGISGRAHRVRDPDGRVRAGRFGWKASQPSIEAQVVAALHGDLGITSPARPAEALSALQAESVRAPSGGDPEVDATKIERLAHYCRTLAVPRRRGADDPEVARGERLFAALGCNACHRTGLVTGDASPIAALRQVTIDPYTDLLLHDMGPDLADGRRDGDASGQEWRTPPLWGIGLLETVNRDARYLHDGRARTLEEAILWHGGEAKRARDAFAALTADERRALVAFLRSL